MRKLCIIAGLVLGMAQAPGAFAVPVTGSSVGTWVDPVGTPFTGVGTTTFTWGTTATGSIDNKLVFTPVASFSSSTEAPFKVGSLYYQNGAVFDGSTAVDLHLTVNLDTPALGPVTGNYTFNLIGTDNTGTPDQNADIVEFPSGFSTTSFLIGSTFYRVRLVGFENVVGDGFLASNSTEFHVREQLHASADVYAVVTSAPVPEPSTYLTMALGLAGLGVVARRRSVG